MFELIIRSIFPTQTRARATAPNDARTKCWKSNRGRDDCSAHENKNKMGHLMLAPKGSKRDSLGAQTCGVAWQGNRNEINYSHFSRRSSLRLFMIAWDGCPFLNPHVRLRGTHVCVCAVCPSELHWNWRLKKSKEPKCERLRRFRVDEFWLYNLT